MKRLNCWEFMKCSKQQQGDKVDESGICPAAMDNPCNGLNGGEYGGRVCWAIAGTLCGGKVQGTLATKILDCFFCDFYRKVKYEESEKFTTFANIADKIYS